ncbi:hypothetical protein Nepgr_022034 [Nepenthes gracilis]|uniref:Glutaredoxin domain-containing protein n=1 Tax=Nepenthes gracilis TaxID=150966 RepID=A0AAD3SXV1_NEPGR|nr:hypothetical protein Nepgr_022034 [Nepenthes gracilis]
MGCSASRPDILLSKSNEEPFSVSSHSPAAFSSASTAKSPPVPTNRSLSAPLVHHLPLRKGDSHHLVSLTSTTYGSLVLVDRHPTAAADSVGDFDGWDSSDQSQSHTQNSEAVSELKEPSSPDSVINTWELMEGLDDDFNFDCGNSTELNSFNSCYSTGTQKIPNFRTCFDSCESAKKLGDSYVFVEQTQRNRLDEESNSNSKWKPLWKHLSEESLLSKMDPNVSSSYRQALSSRQLDYNLSRANRSKGSSPSIPKLSSSVTSGPLISSSSTNKSQLPACEDRIVLYFTSLRGIRRTYEDCCAVRMIFRGFRVPIDERDISMDSTYRKELQGALGGKEITLPQVFIRGRHVGGAEEITQLHEVGELANLLEGFPVHDSRFVCESCGDARFVPCPNCNGSRKLFQEEEGRSQKCPGCNENGLIRCPVCCS